MRRRLLAALLTLAGGLTAATSAAAATGTLSINDVERQTASPTGAAITLGVGDASPGMPAQLQSARITLPAGLTWSPAAGVADARQQCSTQAFAVGAAGASSCPASSVVGTASLSVPGEPGPRTGTIALGPPTGAGTLPSLLVEASEGGSSLPGAARSKLIVALARGDDGRLSLLFEQIPAPAFSNLTIRLAAGPGALLTTPPSCGATAATATLVDAADASRFDTAAPITFDAGCSGPAAPGDLSIGQGTTTGGERAPVSLTARRHARAPALTEVFARLPGGLLGDLTNAADCATFPACGEASLIGTLRVAAGNGPAPLIVSGPVYLTVRPGGAVAGIGASLSVGSPAGALGTVHVTGRIVLRPTDAGLDVQLALPTTAGGVPLALQSAELLVDRPGFVLHPSRCGPLGWSGGVVADGGSVGASSGVLTYGGCDSRRFSPTLEATLTGETAPLGHPTVKIALTARDPDAHLAAAEVRLPPSLAADLANVDNPCPLALFEAVDCSADTRVGTAVARVSLTGEPVPGDVFLIRVPGQVLPGLGMSFTGRFAQRVVATVVFGKDNRLLVTYPAIPDLPLRRLDMTVTGGAGGPLRVVAGACRKGMVWDASFTAYGGQRSSHTIPAPCPLADASRAKISLSTAKGLRVVVGELGGRLLHSAKITLPSRYAFVKARADNKRFRSLRLGVGTGRIRVLPRSVQVYPKTRSANRLELVLKDGTVRGPRVAAGKQAKSVLVEVRLAFTDGTVQRQRIRVIPK